jgi:NAD(P)-dependent dehydrogenase (short-subunit alcohol dehydrogenase family)
MNSGESVFLKGRCALVTGSVAGLGYAIAEKLSEAGAAVVLNGLATAQEAEATRNYLAERQPGGRFVAMESVGSTIVFLCSKAGADITGTVLPVDGGWTAN